LAVQLTGGASGSQSRSVTGTPNANRRESFTFDLSGIDPVGGTFTATVTATDAAGRSATATRQFLIPDQVPPRLANVAIIAGDGGLPPAAASLWTRWFVDFSEPKSPAMLDAANYRLSNADGQEFPVLVSAAGLPAERVRLTPANPLQPGIEYTLRLLPGLTDAAGNILAANDGSPMPDGGFAFSLRAAAITSVKPESGFRIVPGQSLPVEVLFENGIGANTWQFALNDAPFVTAATIPGHRRHRPAFLRPPAGRA
jgi:hypothetical protein